MGGTCKIGIVLRETQEMRTGFLLEDMQQGYHFGDLAIEKTIILKLILMK